MEDTATATPTSFNTERNNHKFVTTKRAGKSTSTRPNKSVKFCTACGRNKILFDTQKKAELFIRYNAQDIETETGYAPVRVYFCEHCGGWHVTSQTAAERSSKSVSQKRSDATEHIHTCSQKNKTWEKLNQVEQYLLHAVKNYGRKMYKRAISLYKKAFSLFHQCMYDNAYQERKLLLFNQLTLCHERFVKS